MFHVERIQSQLPAALGLAVLATLRLGHELTSSYLPLDPLPGLVSAIFLWVLIDLRLRLRHREELRTQHDLRILATGSSFRAELGEALETQGRAAGLTLVLLLPTVGLPGAGIATLGLWGSTTWAVAIVEGGSRRFGTPDLCLGLAIAGYWMAAGGLLPHGLGFDPWNAAAHPAVTHPVPLDLGTALRALAAQSAWALALRLVLVEGGRDGWTSPDSPAQERR
jgi:hypothetical protein